MVLNDIYKIASAINEKVTAGEIASDIVDDIDITIAVHSPLLKTIDETFYKMTHGTDNLEDFHHERIIEAKIDGINFTLIEKKIPTVS